MVGPFKNLGALSGMMKDVQKMMKEIEALKARLEEETVEASSGGGLVTATVTGLGKPVSVKIDPSAIDPDDIEMLEDLVATAMRAAVEKAEELHKKRVEEITGGMDLPGLGGLLGT
jgi:DNA-binding YbaB/EbfC family protein